jgi:uncharacterized membrane protein
MPKQSRNYDEMSIEEKKVMHKYVFAACVLGPLALLYMLFVEGYAQQGTHLILIAVAGFILAGVLGVFHYKKLKNLDESGNYLSAVVRSITRC